MKFRSSFQLSMAALAVALVASSCGKAAPTAPEVPPAPAPAPTPISAVITKIQVTKFPAKTQSGGDWDSSILASARRPDLYVTLTGTHDEYVSNTASNATTGTTYTFTSAVSGGLPDIVHYGTDHRIYLMDEDFGGDDDRMGWVTLNLPAAYGNNGARNLDHTYTDSGNRISIRVIGTWNY